MSGVVVSKGDRAKPLSGISGRRCWEQGHESLPCISLFPMLQARRESIEEQLQQIRAGDMAVLVRQAWERHHGVMCAGVYWDRYSERLSIVALAGLHHMRKLC